MGDWLERSRLLLQAEGIEKLQTRHVLIAGLGGVGSWAAEFICRAGVGQISIIDHDVVKESNINRQLCALNSTVGKEKTEVMAARLMDINPNLKLNVVADFLKNEKTPELIHKLKPDYIIDAIDTLSPKVYLIHFALSNNFPIVSSLGAGGRIDPTQIQVADISESHSCRLAFYIRKRLRKLGIRKGLTVVFSKELVADETVLTVEDEENKKSTVGTISYIPALFGGFCAGEVIKGLLK